EQLAHEAALRAARAVAEHRGHDHVGVLPDHGAGLSHRTLARIELDLQELQLLALDLEVDVVGDARVAVMGPGARGRHRMSPAEKRSGLNSASRRRRVYSPHDRQA